MKKIILPALLLSGLFVNAQTLTVSKLVLTNSPVTQTFANNNARIITSTVLGGGTVVDGATEGEFLALWICPSQIWMSLQLFGLI